MESIAPACTLLLLSQGVLFSWLAVTYFLRLGDGPTSNQPEETHRVSPNPRSWRYWSAWTPWCPWSRISCLRGCNSMDSGAPPAAASGDATFHICSTSLHSRGRNNRLLARIRCRITTIYVYEYIIYTCLFDSCLVLFSSVSFYIRALSNTNWKQLFSPSYDKLSIDDGAPVLRSNELSKLIFFVRA